MNPRQAKRKSRSFKRALKRLIHNRNKQITTILQNSAGRPRMIRIGLVAEALQSWRPQR